MPRNVIDEHKLRQLENAVLSGINTKSAKQIAKELDISVSLVSEICKENGINLRTFRHQKYLERYEVNLQLFTKWSKKMAWVLGILTTDGNVTDAGVITLAMNIRDIDCVEKVRDIIAPKKQLTFTREGTMAVFSIYSPELKKQLEVYGVTPRKSLTVRPPDNIPDEFVPHYIRGLLEGDGTISFSGNTGVLGFYGTIHLMKFISRTISRLCNLPEQTIYIREEDELVMLAAIKYALKKAVVVRHFLYDDSTEDIRMNRKYKLSQDLVALLKQKGASRAAKQWTPEEDEILKKYHAVMPATVIQKKIFPEKKVSNIRKRLTQLGINWGRMRSEAKVA